MSDDERPLLPETPLIPSPSPVGAGRREHVAASPVEPGESVRGEGELWRDAMPRLSESFREIGYDIASSPSGSPPGDSIVARRDLGDRVVVLAIDASGRFRAEITWVVGEWPSRDEVAGVPVRVIDTVSRAVTVTGQMSGPDQLMAVVKGLGTIVSWASVSGAATPPPPV